MQVTLKHSYTTNTNHALNNVDYISTRDGVVYDNKSTTPSQINYIKALEENVIDNLKDLDGYSEYHASNSKVDASKYISSLESLMQASIDANKYLDYITCRKGSTGLFNKDGLCDLKQATDDLLEYKELVPDGRIYMPIISLRKQDAINTGFDNIDSWRNMVNIVMPTFANKMGINMNDLVWSAAYHEKETNPHVHLIIYDKKNKAYLKKSDFEHLRKIVAKNIYKNEMYKSSNIYYEKKNQLNENFKNFGNIKLDEKSFELVIELNEKINDHKGKKNYQYMEFETKKLLSRLISDCLTKDEVTQKLFYDTLNASKRYTGVYSNDDKFIKSLIYPGKDDKKVIQNSIIKFLNENYNNIHTHYEKYKNDKTLEVEKMNVIKTMKSNSLLRGKIVNDLSKINYSSLDENLKEKLDRFFYIKGIREYHLKNHLTVEELSKLDSKYKELKKIDFFDIISDQDYYEINKLFGYETREVKETILDKIYEQISDNIKEYSSILNIHDNFGNDINLYSDIEDTDKILVNNSFKEILLENQNAEQYIDEYITKKIKSDFLNQEDIINYNDFYNANFDEMKNNFIEGKDNVKIHQFIYSAMKYQAKEMNEVFIKHQVNVCEKWFDEFKSKLSLDYSVALYNDLQVDDLKYDLIQKTKVAAKAMIIAGVDNDKIKTSLDSILSKSKDAEIYNNKEIIKSSLAKLASEKTLIDLKGGQLSLSKKEQKFLSISSNIEIKEYKNNYKAGSLSLFTAVTKLLSIMNDNEGSSSGGGQNKDNSKNNSNKMISNKMFDNSLFNM